MHQARDLKLKREVAIKILPEEFSRDSDRVSRFQREAEWLMPAAQRKTGAVSPQIHVVLNWFEDVKQRMAAH